MSKRWRTREARELVAVGESLGFDAALSATGHIRFRHRATGAIVIAASKNGGRAMRNDVARFRRTATASEIKA